MTWLPRGGATESTGVPAVDDGMTSQETLEGDADATAKARNPGCSDDGDADVW